MVQVAPGTYVHFSETVGVTITATYPGTVLIELDTNYVPATCTGLCLNFERTQFWPPPGQESHCIGLRFLGNTAVAGGIPLRHRVTATGRVSFENCDIAATNLVALECSGASPLLNRALLPGVVAQRLGLGSPEPAGLLLTDAAAQAQTSWQIPSNPALVNARLWFQGVSGTELPLNTSPAVGGFAR